MGPELQHPKIETGLAGLCWEQMSRNWLSISPQKEQTSKRDISMHQAVGPPRAKIQNMERMVGLTKPPSFTLELHDGNWVPLGHSFGDRDFGLGRLWPVPPA